MAIPAQLEQILSTALDRVLHEPRHALAPFQRRVVYEYLAESSDTAHRLALPPLSREAAWDALASRGVVRNPVAWRRRMRLDLLTARRMRDLWHELRPHDDLAYRMYAIAEDAAMQGIDYDSIEEETNAVFFQAETADYSFHPPYYALNAIIASILTACRVNTWDGITIEPEDDDRTLELDTLDAAGFACDAVAGPVWNLKSDPSKRLEFWTWWLTEAIPTVWQREEEETPLVPEE